MNQPKPGAIWGGRHLLPLNDDKHRAVGYSLIEVLIGFAVLALGITSLVSFQGRLMQESNHAKARTEAVSLARTKLEQMRSYPDLATYDAMTDGSDTIGPDDSGADIIIDHLHHTYTRSWVVMDSPGLKTIMMQVAWPNGEGEVTANTSVNLVTTIARVDPTRTALTPDGS